MIRVSLVLSLALVVTGCSGDSRGGKTDSSSAADSAVSAKSSGGGTVVSAPIVADSVRSSVRSTEGTIGETRKTRGKPHVDSTIGRDSAIQGPYHTMDSLGHIKR